MFKPTPRLLTHTRWAFAHAPWRTASKLITLGCNPNLMDRIFDSHVLETLFFAKTYALGVGGRKTAELDVMLCYQISSCHCCSPTKHLNRECRTQVFPHS